MFATHAAPNSPGWWRHEEETTQETKRMEVGRAYHQGAPASSGVVPLQGDLDSVLGVQGHGPQLFDQGSMMDIFRLITLISVLLAFLLAILAECMASRQQRNESKFNERRKP